MAELDALRFVGRKGYGARALLGACNAECDERAVAPIIALRLHADLIMLARLGQAVARAQAVPLAA